jgi:hypothetical protein
MKYEIKTWWPSSNTGFSCSIQDGGMKLLSKEEEKRYRIQIYVFKFRYTKPNHGHVIFTPCSVRVEGTGVEGIVLK